MRINVTAPMQPLDDSAIDQPVLGILAGATEGNAAALSAAEGGLAEVLQTDDLARHRHRRARGWNLGAARRD
ncbi:MAG TPA: hypothetical protein VMZ00_12155 [Sporichthya sp.]|nr:hypothetical protein [Sporichthya sp.]